MAELAFLKLGGSLITDKAQATTPRPEVIARCAAEVAAAWWQGQRLVLGHGSGSFGHAEASRHGTRCGVHTAEQWLGFAQVADVARRLNQLVVAALLAEDLPAIPMPPSALVRASAGEIVHLDHKPIAALLERGALPVVQGDVALDDAWGGTIVSTEQVLAALVPALRPRRIVLAGEVAGVLTADPALDPDAEPFVHVDSANLDEVLGRLGGTRGADVTGGMPDKVRRMHELARLHPGLTVQLVSGLVPGLVGRALLGQAAGEGTVIFA